MTAETTPTTLRDREPGTYPCINCGALMDDCDFEHPCCEDSDHPYATFTEMRTAIEEQAATEARRELLAKVEGLPLYANAKAGVTTTESTTAGLRDFRAAVLRLIEEQP